MNKTQHRLLVLKNQAMEEMTWTELAKSPEMHTYLQNLADGLTLSKDKNVTVKVVKHDGEACTDGKMIFINPESEIPAAYDNKQSAFKAYCGLLFHELGHVNFNNFTEERALEDGILKGVIPGELPAPMNEEEEERLERFQQAFADSRFTPVLRHMYHDISNRIADPHDEAKMMNHFGSFIGTCIKCAEEALWRETKPLEDLKENDELTAFLSMILQYARFGKILMYGAEAKEDSSLWDLFDISTAQIDKAKLTDETDVKYTAITRMLFNAWDLIDQKQDEKNEGGGEGEDSKSDSSSGQSSGSSGTDSSPQSSGSSPMSQKAIDRVKNALSKAQQTLPSSADPKNRETSSQAKSVGEGKSFDQEKGDAQAERAMNSVMSQAAEAQAEQELEEEQRQQLNMKVQAVDAGSEHKGIPVKTNRVLRVDQSDIAQHNELMKDLKPYSKKLIREMQRILKDRKEGSVDRYQVFGNKLIAEDTYRKDEKAFAKIHQPEDGADMAVAILVDCSGSMSGERIESSKKAAMLLYDFAGGLDIPVLVAGHNTRLPNAMAFDVYADFDSPNRKDAYRISKMYASGSNRDGYALAITADLLAKRPEEYKLLFIISDGQPADYTLGRAYGGDPACKDIQQVVKSYEQKGVEFIACAIGSDKEQIEKIYGKKRFVDITNLDLLPKAMVNMLKKRILK